MKSIKNTLNNTNDKCMGCKHKGAYMCTTSKECIKNSLYEKKNK